jgi:hypothetical protein
MEDKEVLKTNSKVYYYYGIAGILGIIVVLFVATLVVPKVLVTLTKAVPSSIISIDNSYVLGDKMLAKADGQDKAVVNVFVLDKDSKGVAGKTVSLRGNSKIDPATEITDNQGKAVFNLTSTVETQDKITAVIEGVSMGKTVTVTFRK